MVPGAVDGPEACSAGSLRAEVRDGGAGLADVLYVYLSLPPAGAPCIVQGVPRVDLLDTAGHVLRTEQTATSLPGGNPVPVRPGANGTPQAQAHFAVHWAPCSAGSPQAAALRAILPGQVAGITVALTPSVFPGGTAPCGGTLNVGPLLPG